ncbi:MAG TPA: DUF47 family protein [Mycobacteriales bacterium]|nr:DUF47 family protein [Mycobacteriales bacterium]
MRISLKPSDDSFYTYFCQATQNLVRGAAVLTELTADRPDFAAISAKLVDIEHETDDVTHAMLRKLNSTFVTPFDREDIYRLGSTLDDVMDHMEAAGTLLHLYGLDELAELPTEMATQIEVIVSSANLLNDAMPRLKPRKGLEEYWIAANELENAGDRAYRMLLARLFSGEYEALTVMKLKEVADELEAAVDAFEHVSNVVETITVKES